MFTGSQLLCKLLLQILHPQHVVTYAVCLVNFTGLLVPSLKLQVKSFLILVEIDLPTVKITKLQIRNIVDFQQSFEVFVQVAEVLSLQLLLREICKLSHRIRQRLLTVRRISLQVVINYVNNNHVVFPFRILSTLCN